MPEYGKNMSGSDGEPDIDAKGDGRAEHNKYRGDMALSDWSAVRKLNWNTTQLRIIDMLQANEYGVAIAAFKAFTSSIRNMISAINSELRKHNLPYQIYTTTPFKERKSPIEYKIYRISTTSEK